MDKYLIKRGDKPVSGLQKVWVQILSLLLASSCLFAGYTSDHIIISGGMGQMSGFLTPAIVGDEQVSGVVTVFVGEPFVSTQPMSGGGKQVEVGFWSHMLRQPG